MPVNINVGLADLFMWSSEKRPVTLRIGKKVAGKFQVVEQQDTEYVSVPQFSDLGDILVEFLEIVYGIKPVEDWRQRALDKGLPTPRYY